MAEAAFDLRAFMHAEWMADANCRGLDTNLFFPERGMDTFGPKSICRECDVQAECLAYALNSDEHHGIWGGKSERDRRRIRRRRGVLATGPSRHVEVQVHGTLTGYRQHRQHGTTPCQACKSAYAVYEEFRHPSREREA